MPNADVLIVGSGAAALQAAEKLCHQKNVIIFTKRTRYDGNTNMAQGGIAAALAADDRWEWHYEDTMRAGCYHNDAEAVAYLVRCGPEVLRQLLEEGMAFDQDESGLSLGQEGAHSQRRILHAGGDATGANLLRHMQKRVEGRVRLIEHEMVLEIIVQDGICLGVATRGENGEIRHYYAPHTILAAGGAGGLYEFHSNNSTITGDALALAYRAGCELVDLEFMQFHPTMLYVDGRCAGLVSEAVRGEGAFLQNSSGEQFMKGLHEQQDLAPRDVVARAIHEQMLQGERVFLNIAPVEKFAERFPTITALCRHHGVAVEEALLPVVPGAHFLMGGVRVDLDGETGIQGLYAVGEAACNGVHGANRLASNSLLEGLVFGERVGRHILQKPDVQAAPCAPAPQRGSGRPLPAKRDIQQRMSRYAGIVRTEESLLQMKTWLEECLEEEAYGTLPYESMTNEEVTVHNMLTAAWLMTRAALQRKESIGGHCRLDGITVSGPVAPIILTKQSRQLAGTGGKA
ncbi:L-aspartate oxidase [Ectobacillus ponti]|uniref:L-aspartate oxidase n=1 Tax=Ectobacillus ponti TaxID=2961894 RepID=A0AA41X6M5_9BACI|nr:L-aspartate oxidase [Ectobacillus ponti]MCP8967305.1 L-aspartate oxidase [Ectobacillus ponti]